jgi:hypothetical protein
LYELGDFVEQGAAFGRANDADAVALAQSEQASAFVAIGGRRAARCSR